MLFSLCLLKSVKSVWLPQTYPNLSAYPATPAFPAFLAAPTFLSSRAAPAPDTTDIQQTMQITCGHTVDHTWFQINDEELPEVKGSRHHDAAEGVAQDSLRVKEKFNEE